MDIESEILQIKADLKMINARMTALIDVLCDSGELVREDVEERINEILTKKDIK